MSSFRKYGTCFFEQYAKLSLEYILGEDFACLVNKDRPDLQSPDEQTLGIEVTRAMEESRKAEDELLKDISGIKSYKDDDQEDFATIIENGYAYGLKEGRYIGVKEVEYWSMALPLKRILESKVAKVGNGFYGRYDRMGLYIFCKDPLKDKQALGTCRYAISLQKWQDIRYDRLYLSEVDSLYVCNLDEGLSDSSRVVRYPITQQQRRELYLDSVSLQLGSAY